MTPGSPAPPAPGSLQVQRYHALDALRAAMMLLGLVLHSAASYTQMPLGWAWPYHDRQTSVAFDIIIFFIHLFRMPVFFVVAGFFAALLYYRDGARGLARNRAMRVALPLLMFWGLMIPLVGYGFIWSVRRIGGEMPWGPLLNQPVYRQPILGHLWFLYYLLVYYAAAIAVLPVAARLPQTIRERVDTIARVLASRWWGPAALAAVTTITLLPMEAPGLDTAPALLPPPRVLVAYAVFFTFGWLLLRQRDLIAAFGARWKAPFLIGAAASAAYLFIVVAQRGFTDARVWHLTAVPFAALAIWFLTFGITGLFVRYLERPRPLVRYFSDASYWMYLTHAAPAAWLPGILADSTAPAAVKFAFVVGMTTMLTVATYHLFVRSTVIGELLNGRRYPRRLPALVVS